MKSILKIFIVTIPLFTCFSSCDEDNLPNEDISVVRIENEVNNDFDAYLQREFVDKYNVELNYKLSFIELNLNQTVVPADYEKSIRMANIMKFLCFEPFDKVAPENFMKFYFPKQVVLIGSGAFQNNGTVILGTAESGRKISLYDVNSLDLTDVEVLFRRYFRTIYHEFAHIWHQTLPFSVDFNQITPTTYTGDSWNESWGVGESLQAGYISDYASNEPNEDFVELIAHYVTFTPDRWNQTLVDAGTDGAAIINQKINIVRNYLATTWSIDIDELRDEILDRASRLDEQDFDNIN
ncbi:zinc-binding metallopeptidase [Tenacibaculum sp. M341]|uniref:zinc-binding metallopeptidase n=1 Tax=Tenacibaculum sp. M341 TaxID=2530339 RepID=UPI001049B013|nr:putative zinc-binding metallopeptidase [Tenacibaculum sp. M341]TCI85915.1 hypothetical protein EYW44_15830 [Tenacibaculum sp. M341]